MDLALFFLAILRFILRRRHHSCISSAAIERRRLVKDVRSLSFSSDSVDVFFLSLSRSFVISARRHIECMKRHFLLFRLRHVCVPSARRSQLLVM